MGAPSGRAFRDGTLGAARTGSHRLALLRHCQPMAKHYVQRAELFDRFADRDDQVVQPVVAETHGWPLDDDRCEDTVSVGVSCSACSKQRSTAMARSTA